MECESLGFLQSFLHPHIPQAKELAQESYHLEPRVRRTPLHLEANNLLCKAEDAFNQDPTVSSPISSTVQSPLSPLFQPLTPMLDSKNLDSVKEPASGPKRAKFSPASASKPDREKRKRSRVTPEQLVQLEQSFSTERSPTAARRKEISERLGMHERQTQIWFQNRLDFHPKP